MSELVGAGSKYTDDQRIEAAVQYAIKGSLSAVSRELNIPRSTMVEWKSTGWWDETIGKVRQETNDLFIADATRIIKKATKRTEDTLDEADCRTAATVGAIYYDKLRLALGQPTSISSKAEGIEVLAQQFRELSERWEEKQVGVVSTQEGSHIEGEGGGKK